MELFRQINNEALDEDNKIRRQVVERLKKQVALFNQPYKAPAELSDVTLNNIQRYIINFDDTLNKTLNDISGRGDKEDTGDLILNYNLLANYLNKINFNLLGASDKKDIFELLDELSPKLGKILSIIKAKGFKDVDLVEKVFNNFKNHTYSVILEKERYIIEREAEQREAEIKPLISLDEPVGVVDTLTIVKSRLQKLLEKSRNIVLRQPIGTVVINRIGERARTYLLEYESDTPPSIRNVSKFLDSSEKTVDAFLNKGKSLLEDEQDEQDGEGELLNPSPLLQQGIEEVRMPQLEQSKSPSKKKK